MHNKPMAVAAEFYHNYINYVEENDITKVLKKNEKKFLVFLENIPKSKINFAYAEDKWTIKQLLQHMIDAERVFMYRALWLARKSNTELPGFDENSWAAVTDVTKRKWKDMVKEFEHLRTSTILMFASFTQEELLVTGKVNNHDINAAALGYICTGHVVHHMHIIEERYLSKKKK